MSDLPALNMKILLWISSMSRSVMPRSLHYAGCELMQHWLHCWPSGIPRPTPESLRDAIGPMLGDDPKIRHWISEELDVPQLVVICDAMSFLSEWVRSQPGDSPELAEMYRRMTKVPSGGAVVLEAVALLAVAGMRGPTS